MQTSQSWNTVLVDDSNPGIQYGPGWVNKLSLLAQSDPNYPMYGTLHEAVSQTDLTYSVSGSDISACAQFVGPANTPGFHVSLWTCFVDGVKIVTTIDYTSYTLCCFLPNEELNTQVQHDIHISAIGSKDQPILFDYLTYQTPLALPIADLYMGFYDPALHMEGWEQQEDILPGPSNSSIAAMVTTEPKANFTVDFYGTSLLWFGFYNTSFIGYSESILSYSINNESEASRVQMEIDSSMVRTSLNGSSSVQILVFQTFALPHGQHRLQLNYSSSGSGKAVPLTLTYLVIQNSTTDPNLSVPTTTLTPSAAPSAVANGARRPHLAIILGCSGAAILALLIFGIFFACRRVKRRRDRASPESGTSSLIEPFSHDPASAPVGTHQKGQRPSEVQEQDVVGTAEVQVEAPPSYITGPHDS